MAISAGKVNVVNGSTTITGVGTNWPNDLERKIIMIADNRGVAYRIVNVNNATSITIDNPYEGPTANGLAYIIGFEEELSVYTTNVIARLWNHIKDVYTLGASRILHLKRTTSGTQASVRFQNNSGAVEYDIVSKDGSFTQAVYWNNTRRVTDYISGASSASYKRVNRSSSSNWGGFLDFTQDWQNNYRIQLINSDLRFDKWTGSSWSERFRITDEGLTSRGNVVAIAPASNQVIYVAATTATRQPGDVDSVGWAGIREAIDKAASYNMRSDRTITIFLRDGLYEELGSGTPLFIPAGSSSNTLRIRALNRPSSIASAVDLNDRTSTVNNLRSLYNVIIRGDAYAIIMPLHNTGVRLEGMLLDYVGTSRALRIVDGSHVVAAHVSVITNSNMAEVYNNGMLQMSGISALIGPSSSAGTGFVISNASICTYAATTTESFIGFFQYISKTHRCSVCEITGAASRLIKVGSIGAYMGYVTDKGLLRIAYTNALSTIAGGVSLVSNAHCILSNIELLNPSTRVIRAVRNAYCRAGAINIVSPTGTGNSIYAHSGSVITLEGGFAGAPPTLSPALNTQGNLYALIHGAV